MTDQRWLHPLVAVDPHGRDPLAAADQPRRHPLARLVCLPHAGGSPSFFRDWPQHLAPRIEAHAICYPGRHDRFTDPVITTMSDMVREVATALVPLADRPLWLFGHSMGAAIAYETARVLTDVHGVRLSGLIASGFPPPHRLPTRNTIHLQDDDAIIADVLGMGAADSAVLAEPELRELVLPALRADYTLIENYHPAPAEPLDIPLIVAYGNDDDDAAAPAAEWSRHTSRSIEELSLPGGHFYLQDHALDLLSHLSRHILATPEGS